MSGGNYYWRSTTRRVMSVARAGITNIGSAWLGSLQAKFHLVALQKAQTNTSTYALDEQFLWIPNRNQQIGISLQPSILSTSRHNNPMRIIMNDLKKLKHLSASRANSENGAENIATCAWFYLALNMKILSTCACITTWQRSQGIVDKQLCYLMYFGNIELGSCTRNCEKLGKVIGREDEYY